LEDLDLDRRTVIKLILKK